MIEPGMAAPAAATPNGTGPAAPMNGGNVAVMQFRKALGLPDNQPAPEQKVIDACMGRLGPDAKRMAEAIAGPAPAPEPRPAPAAQSAASPAPPTAPATSQMPPSTPDPGQAGGESAPPDPNSPPDAHQAQIQPGSQTGGKMGAATIFGRQPVPVTGEQGGAQEDEEEDMPRAQSVFGRRR